MTCRLYTRMISLSYIGTRSSGHKFCLSLYYFFLFYPSQYGKKHYPDDLCPIYNSNLSLIQERGRPGSNFILVHIISFCSILINTKKDTTRLTCILYTKAISLLYRREVVRVVKFEFYWFSEGHFFRRLPTPSSSLRKFGF